MKLSTQRQGELFIFGNSFLWSLFPVITILSFSQLSPLVSLLFSVFFSSIFFTALMIKKRTWHELRNIAALKNITIMTLILGIGYYFCIFIGLQYTSAGNAAIIGLTQILFSYLFFHVLRKDHIPMYHIFGALLMVAGALIVLASGFTSFNIGDVLIVLANAFSPFGNHFAQKARKQVTSETIMFIRSIMSSVLIFLILISLNTSFSVPAIQNSLPFLLINGILLLGLSKIFWIEGIHRISVTKANALSSIEPFLTITFAWFLLLQAPTIWQLMAIVPICLGVILLSKKQADDVTIET